MLQKDEESNQWYSMVKFLWLQKFISWEKYFAAQSALGSQIFWKPKQQEVEFE